MSTKSFFRRRKSVFVDSIVCLVGLAIATEVTIIYPGLDPGVTGTVDILGAGPDGRTTYAIVPSPSDLADFGSCL